MLVRSFSAALGRRAYRAELLDHALAYPWERPARSFVLRDGDAQPLHDLPSALRRREIERFAADGRHPIVAIGSNAAPHWLHAKLAHFAEPEDRTALVLAGELHDLDVGPAATVSAYGALPATLFASPGTSTRAAVLWLTPAQVTQLTWSELSYRLGRLETAAFTADEEHVEIDALFAYINRFGTLRVDGAPVALAAVPARSRTATAMTQRQLLDAVASRLGYDGAGAAGLVEAVFDDMAAVADRAGAGLWREGERLDHAHWTPYPARASNAR